MKLRDLTHLFLVWLAFLAINASSAAPKQEQLQKQYDAALASLKADDEAGYTRLAQWCQTNHLTKEAEHVWQLLLTKKREDLAKKPSLPAYQALIAWCTAQGLKQSAEDVRHEMLVYDYGQRKAKLAPGDANGLQTLAQWCQQNKLTAEALEAWQAVLALQPDNAAAKTQLEAVRIAAWAEAPTGLLKKQTVPGYTQDSAWYHVSVPAKYKEAKGGMPMLIFLHGGGHNQGTADNIVALAQVLPEFKNYITVFPNHLKTWWAHPREMKYLLEIVDQVTIRWHVDPKRIYLMGASMGGNGVWAFGSQCSELFAGVAPCSGFWEEFLGLPMKNLDTKPVYILHGTQDTTVPNTGAKKAFDLLKKDGCNVILREPECGHQIPNDEFGKAVVWLEQYTNKQDFDLKALKERVAAMTTPNWLKQYEGN